MARTIKPISVHAAKYALYNYHCGNCSTGVVQIFSKWSRGGNLTTVVSGCLDCKYEYGIKQASELEKYSREDIRWP